jgi:hypothetical protein
MKSLLIYLFAIILVTVSCRNNPGTQVTDAGNESDSAIIPGKKSTSQPDQISEKKGTKTEFPSVSGKEAKTVEFEIVKVSPADTSEKMSFFHSDKKYFKADSIYCAMLYKLREVRAAANEKSPEGDYITMMVDERPEGDSHYYQIALCKIRRQLNKMDRLETYRIDVKSHQIEKHDVVKDKWIALK